jgi:acyl carrier protein
MTTYDEIYTGLRELLVPLAGEGKTVDEDSDLIADLGLSSLKIMDLLMEIEDRFDVTVPLNLLPDIRTVRDFAQQLERLIQDAQH